MKNVFVNFKNDSFFDILIALRSHFVEKKKPYQQAFAQQFKDKLEKLTFDLEWFGIYTKTTVEPYGFTVCFYPPRHLSNFLSYVFAWVAQVVLLKFPLGITTIWLFMLSSVLLALLSYSGSRLLSRFAYTVNGAITSVVISMLITFLLWFALVIPSLVIW